MISLLFLVVVIALVILFTTKFKVHPFISLLAAALLIGFIEGMEGTKIVSSISTGFGNTLKSIGIIIAFGTIIGAYLEHSGGARTLADRILKIVGKKKSDLAMTITGFVVSIPVFCDSGFVVLSTLNKSLSKKSGISMAVLAIALATGLYVTHVFVPPTPGPLAAAAAVEADIGLIIFLGLIVGIPTTFVGLLWARYINKKVDFSSVNNTEEDIQKEEQQMFPSFVDSLLPIIVPIILIGLKSIAEYPSHPFGTGIFFEFLAFIGNPIIALLIGVLLVFRLKKFRIESDKKDWLVEGLKNAGIIILITGAGGAFGNVLRDTNIGDTIGALFADYEVGLFLPFILAALLKSAQGSSTVSIITTAAIVAPLLASFGLDGETAKALVVLAIGAGAMTVSHINDSYFWVVSQFSGFSTSQALRGFTAATLLLGVTGIIFVYILSLFLI